MEVWDNYNLRRISDIKIQVEGNVYELHKIVLCASPYFFTMLNGNFTESNEELVTLDFVDTRTWVYILRYLYNKIKHLLYLYNIKEKDYELSSLTDADILKIKVVSDLLLLEELTNNCGYIIKKKIDKYIYKSQFDMLDNIAKYLDDDIYSYLIKKFSNIPISVLYNIVQYSYSIPDSELYMNKNLWINILDLRYPNHEKTNEPLLQLKSILEDSIKNENHDNDDDITPDFGDNDDNGTTSDFGDNDDNGTTSDFGDNDDNGTTSDFGDND